MKSAALSLLVAAGLAVPALAEGDISLMISGGQIVTTKVSEGGDPLGPSRVFSGLLTDVLGEWYTAEPGLQIDDGTLTPGTDLRLYFSKALRQWNGSSFASVAGGTISATFGPLTNSIVTPGSDTNSANLLFPVEPLGGLHDHPDWVLAGHTPSGGPEFFLVEARFAYNGSTDSDPFYIVFGLNATEEQLEEIEGWVETNIVPTPGSLALLAIAGLAARRRRSGRRCP
jgi:hypothetical protein